MKSMLNPELLFNSLISVTAILFGLFGVFLAGFEIARTQPGVRWKAYGILAILIGSSVIMGGMGTLFAFWGINGGPASFNVDPQIYQTWASNLLAALVAFQMISVIVFGIAYIVLTRR